MKQLRLAFADDLARPVLLDVVHVDLHFYFEIDVAVLIVEVCARDVRLAHAQRVLEQFGRIYPTFWTADGSGGRCVVSAQWLSGSGEVLAASDFERRDGFPASVCRYRDPAIAAHWEFLARPLVFHHSSETGVIRYSQIEDHHLPVLGWLAVDDARQLTRGDFMRLAFATPPGDPTVLPFSERQMHEFERHYCYDRYWEERADVPPGVRYLCTGHTFVMVGSASDAYFTDAERGLLGHFRHQYFLLLLAPHFYKATLLMISDRLVTALNRLDVGDSASVRRFKLEIRALKETFLRFSHRYWFLEVSGVQQANEIFRMCSEHLGTARLYAHAREEIHDMSAYLDSDSLRRQANTVVRLTVVTAFGLIGTMATGFLGMNVINAADNPLAIKVLYFLLVFVPIAGLTLYTIAKSKRLSDFLEALADERLPAGAKWRALLDVWRAQARGKAIDSGRAGDCGPTNSTMATP